MPHRRLAVLAIITFLAHAHGAFGANTYYVAPTTTGTPNGSITNPFTSFTTAINTAVAGDTIYVRGGTYNLSSTISISSSKNGTAANPYNLLALSRRDAHSRLPRRDLQRDRTAARRESVSTAATGTSKD